MKTVSGYHFTGDTLHGGAPIPPIGEWLVHTGPIVPCASGLHMAEHPMHSLAYAYGTRLHKVELRGELVSRRKPFLGLELTGWVGRERRIIASADATEILRYFARWNAHQVLWVWQRAGSTAEQYLERGNPLLKRAVQKVAEHKLKNYSPESSEGWAVRATLRATADLHPCESARRASRAAREAHPNPVFTTIQQEKFLALAQSIF